MRKAHRTYHPVWESRSALQSVADAGLAKERVNLGLGIRERATCLNANGLDRHNTNRDDQRKHYSVFNGGWTIFFGEESQDSLHEMRLAV